MDAIEAVLKQRQEEGLLRSLRPAAARKEGKVRFKDKEYIDFSSNDYLGFSGHPRLIEAVKEAAEKYGTGSGASRLMSGDLDLHHRLEEKVAGFKNKERALVFNSGYQANAGIISALYGKEDCIFSDRLNHASIIDGITLSGARLFRFRHNDPGHLKALIEKERGRFKNALIVTESIFSMDGDRAPLKEMADLKQRSGCEMMVDEAHATGIFGKNGSGVVEEDGLSREIDLIMGTFSKALGSFGAYLAASGKVIDYLINTCRSFIYSTALPPAVIACNIKAVELVAEEPWRREELLLNAEFLRQSLKEKGLDIRGASQIIPLVLGGNKKALNFAGALQEKGFFVRPIRYPTVPQKEARLRFSLTVDHKRDILQRLIDEIPQIGI